MQTIKTGVVVALLLAVCYGAFVALNTPEPELPDELLSEFDWNSDDADIDGLMEIEMPGAPTANSLDVQLPSLQTNAASLPNSLDASGLDVNLNGLPTLPGFTAPANSTPSLPTAPTSLATPITSNSGPAASQIQLPNVSLPPLPQESAGTPSTAASGISGSLPTLPVTATTDGPSVSIAGTGSGTSSGAVSAEGQAVPGGQMISQTVPVSTAAAGMQLPLIDVPASSSSAATSGRPTPTQPFATAREQALTQAGAGKLREALQMMSAYYNSPELKTSEHNDLVDLLDALSREVIYSQRHLVEAAYKVTATDTLESVASAYKLTPEFLAAVNRMGDSKALVDGSQLKVLPGPFWAEVSLSRQELTLFLGELYAGRFPVSFGEDPVPVEGTFEIIDRRRDRAYFGAGGNLIAATDSRNPYGGYWLGMAQDMCIHGTAEMSSDELANAGCISLAPLDAADVYKILAQTSQVRIVR